MILLCHDVPLYTKFLSFLEYHYQKTEDSWRPKTVRNYRITDRNEIPDGQPSGIYRQDSIVRKDHPFLTVGRQESFPDGSSWWTTGGPVWLNTWRLPVRNMWFWPSGNQLWAVKKLHVRNYIHQIQFVCKFHIHVHHIHISDCHPASYWIRMNKWLQDI